MWHAVRYVRFTLRLGLDGICYPRNIPWLLWSALYNVATFLLRPGFEERASVPPVI
jgi:hypothetical protein